MARSKYLKLVEEICDDPKLTRYVEEGDWANLIHDLNERFQYGSHNIAKYLLEQCEINPAESYYYSNLKAFDYYAPPVYYFDDESSRNTELRYDIISNKSSRFGRRIYSTAARELIKLYADHGITITKANLKKDDSWQGARNTAACQIKPSKIGSDAKVYVLV